MPSTVVGARAVALATLSLALGACRDEPGRTLPQYTYGLRGCMDPQEYCANVHPGTVPRAHCLYTGCFEVTTSPASGMRVRAADEGKAYPWTWWVWHGGTLSKGPAQFACMTAADKDRTRLRIPFMSDRCARTLDIGGVTYHEDFVVSSASECLAWVECGPP